MQRELSDLVNHISSFKQSAGGLVSPIVKSQILDAENLARTCKSGADTFGVVRKNPVVSSWLSSDDHPSLGGHFELPVIAFFQPRVFGIAHDARSVALIQIFPQQVADFVLASS